MKNAALFVIVLLCGQLCHGQDWKTLFTKETKIDGLAPSSQLTFKFDTASSNRSKARWIYIRKDSAGATISLECADSSFESKYSSREFKQVLQGLITGCLSDSLTAENPDSVTIIQKLPVIINYAAAEWYEAISNKLVADKERKVQSNVIDLSYNDSLKANLLLNCQLNIYREYVTRIKPEADTIILGRVDSINIKEKDSTWIKQNLPVGNIAVRNIKLQVSDGFIYSFSFDIDTSLLNSELKKTLRPHQAFSLRYNLRHNILSRQLMDNKPAVYLKKIHTQLGNSASKFVFYPGEFFNYQSPLAAINTIFTARDTVIYYAGCGNSVKPDSIKLREKSLYSILNLDVFGDFVGFFSDNKPNGLLQTELKASFYGFRKPFSEKKTTTARFTMFNKAELFFRLSKLDDKNRFLDILTDTIKNRPQQNDTIVRYVHGYRLLEYQNLYAGLRFNVGEVEFRGGSLAFTGEGTFLRTPLRDTVFKTVLEGSRVDTIHTPIDYGKNSLIIAPGINIKVLAASFCDIDIKGKLFFIRPLTRNIRISSSEFDEFYGRNTFEEITTAKLYNFGVQFTINLNSEKSRRVILRGDAYVDTRTRGNNFTQLQIGYSADLNKFISLNNPAKN